MTRDPLGDAGLADPGVGALISHLTSAPTAEEQAGEHAALAMFAAARSAQAAPAQSAPRTRPGRSRVRLGGRLAAAATVFALAGGFAAAGYAAALPAPLQHVAYQILGFAGVPNSPGNLPPGSHSSPGQVPGGRVPTHHGPASSGAPSPGSSSPSPGTSPSGSRSHSPRSTSPSPRSSSSGSPAPGSSAQLAITASQTQITAGDGVQITATLTNGGPPEPGTRLRLIEHAAGHPGWRLAARAVTGSQGQATFTVPNLTTNAAFQVTGPNGAKSSRLRIVVIPPVTVSVVASAHRKLDVLLVSCPLAEAGNVVQLEVLSPAGQWRIVRVHRLRKAGRAAFTVVIRKVDVSYRAVLLATRAHGESVSNTVIVVAKMG